MASCYEVKKGQVYTCADCGLEVQVIKECEECGTEEATCSCDVDCELECCGQPLVLKQ